MSGSLPAPPLAAALDARIAAARAAGALEPIATEEAVVADAGVPFVVRTVAGLARRDEARRQVRSGRGNPFQPWEEDLFVADVSESHVALLNKYPVLERHLLLVTRRFVPQETLLDGSDFAALARCLAAIDGVAFYNGGPEAGASQPHKHLQVVPAPPAGAGLPVQPLLDAAPREPTRAGRVPGFGFRHAFCRLPEPSAAALHAGYRDLLRDAGLGARPSPDGPRPSAPYNLLLTRGWMLLVARRRERWRGVPVNALGYAGWLFVRTAAQLAAVRRAGPMAVLRAVAVPES